MVTSRSKKDIARKNEGEEEKRRQRRNDEWISCEAKRNGQRRGTRDENSGEIRIAESREAERKI